MGARAIFQLSTPWSAEDVKSLGYEQAADVMVLTHLKYFTRRLTRYAHDNWTLETAQYLATIAPPTGEAVTPSTPNTGTGYTATDYSYALTSIDAVSGQESLNGGGVVATNDLTMKGNYNTITFTKAAAAERTNIYRLGGGSYGFIGTTEGASFVDDNIAPDFSQSFPLGRDPFAGDGNQPATVAFWQQRAMYGRTLNKPNGIFGSQSANLFNMNVSRPLQASDAVSFAVSGRRVNAVLHLVPLKDLIVFTTDTVFTVKGGSGGDVFGPTSIDIQPENYRAAGRVRPVVVDDIVMFSAAKGCSLRTLGYQFEADGYKGNDLTVFAPHLFRRLTILDIAWAEFPASAVYVVGDDGAVRLLTWQAEQDVWGWSKMTTDGVFESCCTVTENGEDVVYFVVRRTLGGTDHRYVEYTATSEWGDVADAVYLDSARRYDGDPATQFSGAEHLAGLTLPVLADGSVAEVTVDAEGRFEMPYAVSKLVIGRPYESWIKTLPPVIPEMKGEPMTIDSITVKVLRSRGIEIGMGKDLPPGQDEPVTSDDEIATIEEVATRELESMGSPTELFSGDLQVDPSAGDWRAASVVVRQRYPLPMHVTGITPGYTVGD